MRHTETDPLHCLGENGGHLCGLAGRRHPPEQAPIPGRIPLPNRDQSISSCICANTGRLSDRPQNESVAAQAGTAISSTPEAS